MDEDEEVLAHVASSRNKVQHAFHAACLRDWLKRNRSCPTCRAEVIDDDSILSGAQQLPIVKKFLLTCLGLITIVIILQKHTAKP